MLVRIVLAALGVFVALSAGAGWWAASVADTVANDVHAVAQVYVTGVLATFLPAAAVTLIAACAAVMTPGLLCLALVEATRVAVAARRALGVFTLVLSWGAPALAGEGLSWPIALVGTVAAALLVIGLNAVMALAAFSAGFFGARLAAVLASAPPEWVERFTLSLNELVPGTWWGAVALLLAGAPVAAAGARLLRS